MSFKSFLLMSGQAMLIGQCVGVVVAGICILMGWF